MLKNQPTPKGIQLEQLRKVQKLARQKSAELYLAKGKHRAMKRTFRGVMSYPQRKILFQIGQNNENGHPNKRV